MHLTVNGEIKFANGEKSEEALSGWKLILQSINILIRRSVIGSISKDNSFLSGLIQ